VITVKDIDKGLVLQLFCFMPFCFNSTYQFTPLPTLCPLLFSLMLCGMFISIYLSLFYGSIIYLCPLFQEHSYSVKGGLAVVALMGEISFYGRVMQIISRAYFMGGSN
jgi:hypothetical protein